MIVEAIGIAFVCFVAFLYVYVKVTRHRVFTTDKHRPKHDRWGRRIKTSQPE